MQKHSIISDGFPLTNLEPMTGFEPVTSSLPRKHSTPELHRLLGIKEFDSF